MTLASLTFRYATFAVLSTLANLAAQALAMGLYRGAAAVVASMAIGTAVGLIVKYRLDAAFIFRFRARDLADRKSVV
jgi:putative flippase GtrA